MATTKETLKLLREKFNTESSGEDEALAAFDRALASVLLDQLDGDQPPELKKRKYTRKPKNTSLEFPPNEK